MRKNKHLLLWSSLGSLALLLTAAVQENLLKEWRRIQARGLSEGEPIPVQLRQIVVPELQVADRCVSCHVGMAPGEQQLQGDPLLAPHPDVVHDPARFGCTVCHGGQSRATEAADAHGAVPHWPEPMIPRRFADAGCGSCHTHLRVPSLDTLRRGRGLFERYDCLACHRLDRRGGTLRPDGGGMEGPDLSRVGATGYRADWYEDHEARRVSDEGGAWSASFASIPDRERALLEAYLDVSVGAAGLVEAKAVFHSLGCRGCHKVGGVGGDDGPDLTLEGQRDPGQLDFTHVPGERSLDRWLAAHFRSPAVVVPGSKMPALGLSEDAVEWLTHYMLSLRRRELPGELSPRDRVRAELFGEREFATDGPTLYGSFCASCHGPQGQGMRYPGMPAFPAIANPDFLAAASDELILATIRHGRPGRRMPAWGESEGGLRPEEIETVLDYLRELGGGVSHRPDDRPDRWARGDAAVGARLYEQHCASCHGRAGEGGEGPALASPVLLAAATDSYLFRTIRNGRRGTSMEGFSSPSTVRPALDDGEIESLVTHLRTFEEGP
jgi:mono/diheme cytochrome c family protein